jgi:hypothetical protein
MLEKEAKSIAERYDWDKSASGEQGVLAGQVDQSTLACRRTQVEAIKEKCRQFEVLSVNSAALQEEQERELAPENERERQVERPPALDPATHSLHPHIREFFETGTLDRSSSAVLPAFQKLLSTRAAALMEKDAWPKDLLITADFARTVQLRGNHLSDDHLRPVHWVASSRASANLLLLVLSPFEANEAIPLVQKHERVTLHVYNPTTSGSMLFMDGLSFITIPAPPLSLPYSPVIRQLNIFAGQLYLKTFDEYVALCRFLGLLFELPKTDIRVSADGFVDPPHRAQYDQVMARECPFTRSPIPFIRHLIAYRRKGLGYEKSHMGAIISGRLLKAKDFPELLEDMDVDGGISL